VVVALAVPALAQDEDSMGMMGPPPAEAAPTASASATAAPVAAVAELPPLTHDLDAIFARAWKEAGVLPAPDAAPGELVRRVYLDLAGRTPTVDEAKEFVASTDPAKLPKTIDKILASHEFAEHMATGLTVVLLGREAQFEALTRNQFRDWLASRLDADAPLDAIAREILGAKADSVVKDPAAQYLMLFGGDPAVIAGRTARIFLGNRIACAQCHDHPYERWKRTDFWSLAAYFQRVRREPVYEPLTEEMKKKKIQQRVIDWKVFEGDGGDTYIPLQNGETGRPALALPRFLGGTYDVMLYGTRQPRLPSLATAVTVEKRHDLARALSNRFFAQLFGRGIVHPVDDFTETHPTTLPEALERITTGFEETGLRLKGYLRALALTQAYGRTSMGQPAASDANVPEKIDARDKAQWTKKAAAEDPALEYFARMRHKPLSPEQALHAFATASGSEEAARAGGEAAVKSWKQTESGLQNQFIQLMSRHDEEDPHSIQEGIPQALVLMNGPGVAYFCQALPNTTVGRAAQEKDVRARIDGLYLAAFARAPSARELGDALAFFDKKDATKATEDYYWSLVNSSEFLYNH
jgi:hypothetical protein